MVKATRTVQQALSHRPQYATWLEEKWRLYNCAVYVEVIQAHNHASFRQCSLLAIESHDQNGGAALEQDGDATGPSAKYIGPVLHPGRLPRPILRPHEKTERALQKGEIQPS